MEGNLQGDMGDCNDEDSLVDEVLSILLHTQNILDQTCLYHYTQSLYDILLSMCGCHKEADAHKASYMKMDPQNDMVMGLSHVCQDIPLVLGLDKEGMVKLSG